MNKQNYLPPFSEAFTTSPREGILAASLFDADNYTENFLDGGEEDL